MTEEIVLDIFRQAVYTIIMCAAPMLLTSLVIGLSVSIFQTVTSIQEQTLTSIPKLVGVLSMVILCGPFIMNKIVTLITELWTNFGNYIY